MNRRAAMAEELQPSNWWNTSRNDGNHSDYTFFTPAADWSQDMLSGSGSSTEMGERIFHGMLHEDPRPPFYQSVLPNPSSSSSYSCSSVSVMQDEMESSANFQRPFFFVDEEIVDCQSREMAYGHVSIEMQQLAVNETSQKFKGSPLKQPSAINTSFFNGASGFYPSSLLQTGPLCFEKKPGSNSQSVKISEGPRGKSSSESSHKKPRTETPSAPPDLKVKKERLGGRITALQQLVSPFGKTDRASVLHEAIEYIKFLHDQVSVLSTPYLKTGHPKQEHKKPGKWNDAEESKQDLGSRGLCLVPITSTYPVADFWIPTFEETYM